MLIKQQQSRFILQPKGKEEFLKIIVEYCPYSGHNNRHNPNEEPVITKVSFKHIPMSDLNMDKDAYETSTLAIACFEKHKPMLEVRIDDYELVKYERSGWNVTARQTIIS